MTASMEKERFIHIDAVSKHFGDVRAVDDVSLDIASGEFFALLGPSGCGKTTLLRILGGFEAPTAGEVYIDGEPVTAVPPYQRPVNMVFQNYAIFPHLNVYHNIAFGLRKQRLPRAELDSRVNDALALIRLEGYGARAAHELSGGQRQRVALARALIKRPKVLLLDEPLGALDKKLREQMQLELRELQKSLGITFVFVTHDQEEALTMSDRIAVMSQGKVLESGAPSQLYAKPRSRFVAEFLGAMNFFDGTIKSRNDNRYVVDAEQVGIVNVLNTGTTFQTGDKVTIGLRPENIRIARPGSGSRTGSVEGVVSTSAYLGDRTHVYVSISDATEPVLVAIQNLQDGTIVPGEANSALSLSWSESAVLLFSGK